MEEHCYKASAERYDGKMQYRRCGRSGVRMSALSLGFWHNFGGVDRLDNAEAMMRYAFDNGITCFDLANNYGPPYGSAEETFGVLMDKTFRPYRDEMFITTKAGYEMWNGPYGNWGSRKYLMSSLDQSLRRMRLDYVDLFYSHRYDPDTPLEETLQALVDIVRQGKALYVGVSRYPRQAAQFAYRYLAERDVPCLCYQGKYNMMYPEDAAAIIPDAQAAGVGYVGFSPLQQGLLTDRYLKGVPKGSRMSKGRFLHADMRTEDYLSRMSRLAAVARERGEDIATMALAWVLRNEGVTSLIVGASSVKQLKINLNALRSAPFSAEQLRAIDRIFAPDNN